MPTTTPKQKPFPEAEEREKKDQNGHYKRPMFVRCDLDGEQKKEMAEWANSRTADDLCDYICESISDGYVLSIKEADTGYQASLTQQKEAAIGVLNSGKCLVTRASTPQRVLWSLYYKHTQVLVKDWSKAAQEATLEW